MRRADVGRRGQGAPPARPGVPHRRGRGRPPDGGMDASDGGIAVRRRALITRITGQDGSYGAAKVYAHHITVNYRESYDMFPRRESSSTTSPNAGGSSS